MKKVSLFLTVILLSLSLMGCNFNKAKNNSATDTADTNVDQNANNDNANNDNNNGDTNLEVAQDAADLITELDGVDSATVIVTDQNAYAAVVLDGDTVEGTDNNDNTDTDTDTNNDTDTDTDTNADAGTDNDNPDQVLSPDLENKIAEKVREANDNIQNVYVSLNPDFVDRMTDYADKIDQGEPVEGFFEEFSEAIQRVFPDAK